MNNGQVAVVEICSCEGRRSDVAQAMRQSVVVISTSYAWPTEKYKMSNKIA